MGHCFVQISFSTIDSGLIGYEVLQGRNCGALRVESAVSIALDVAQPPVVVQAFQELDFALSVVTSQAGGDADGLA